MKIDLSGRIAVVTGSSGELGRVIALTLAQCGADVALHYHQKLDRAKLLREQIISLDRKACIVQADITSKPSIEAMRGVIEAELGSPDILVTNAVGGYEWKPLLQQPAEDYASQFASAAIQNVLMAQTFVPAMITKRWGRIIAISTECVMQHNVGQTAYVAGRRGWMECSAAWPAKSGSIRLPSIKWPRAGPSARETAPPARKSRSTTTRTSRWAIAERTRTLPMPLPFWLRPRQIYHRRFPPGLRRQYHARHMN